MRLGSDSSAHTLRSANRPILLKGRGTNDRWLVGTSGLQNIVGSTVGSDGTLLCSSAGWVIAAVGLDDVVFDEGRFGPSVDGKVSISVGSEGSGVLDHSGILLVDS